LGLPTILHALHIFNKSSNNIDVWNILFYTLFLLLLYWASIVTLTKFHTIFHSLISPLHLSPLSHPPCNSFNRYHFSTYIHVYRIFPPYSLSEPLSFCPPLSHWYPPSRHILTFPLLIFDITSALDYLELIRSQLSYAQSTYSSTHVPPVTQANT
jgi:hypothetical protein